MLILKRVFRKKTQRPTNQHNCNRIRYNKRGEVNDSDNNNGCRCISNKLESSVRLSARANVVVAIVVVVVVVAVVDDVDDNDRLLKNCPRDGTERRGTIEIPRRQ